MTDSIEKIIAEIRITKAVPNSPWLFQKWADRLESLLRDNVMVPRGRCSTGNCDAYAAAPSANAAPQTEE